MDLVDIDKVLDDLELGENQINAKANKQDETEIKKLKISRVLQESPTKPEIQGKEAEICHIVEASLRQSDCPEKKSQENSRIENNNSKVMEGGDLIQKNKGEIISALITQPGDCNPINVSNLNDLPKLSNSNVSDANCSTNKNIGNNIRTVAVSQVFNSLDEYCKDVESLRTDMDKIYLPRSDVNSNEKEEVLQNSSNNSLDNTNDTSKHLYSIIQSTEVKATLPTSSDFQQSSNENCSINDINSPKIVEDDDSIDGFTTSSSITTSSPSSFSSGPSPHSPSSTERLIESNENEIEKISDFRLSEKQSNFFEKSTQEIIETQEDNSNGQNSIDLFGLSSISSGLCVENSISFNQIDSDCKIDQGNLVSGKIEVTSPNFNESGQNENRENIERNLSINEKNVNIDNNCIKTSENKDEKCENVSTDNEKQEERINIQKQLSYSQKYPITFSSTMDEISDAELDSMLQEIYTEFSVSGGWKGFLKEKPQNPESEQDLQENTDGAQNETDKSQNDTFHKSKAAACDSIVPNQSCATNSPVLFSREITADSKKIDDDVLNVQNADSFSQASTIELTDLQCENDPKMIETNGTRSNSISCSDDKSLNFGAESSSIILDGTQKNSTNEIQQQKNSVTKEQSNPQLTRPKLLNLTFPNLPSLPFPNSSINQESSDSLNKPNLTENAGQTPPASETFANSKLSRKQEYASSSGLQYKDSFDSSESLSEERQSIHNKNNPISNQNLQLGKVPPFWIPDSEASYCMQCKVKFSLIKRRHHCRACGHVLCSVCCSQKAKLEFLGNDSEVRVCVQCHLILNSIENNLSVTDNYSNDYSFEQGAVGGGSINGLAAASNFPTNLDGRSSTGNIVTRSPNPNNPMEYCSTIPPHEQVKKNQQSTSKPISVMVPVGVLKREGTYSKSRKDKNVIFSDGIRPGCDLADLDKKWPDNKTGNISNSLTGSNTSSGKKDSFDKDYVHPVNLRILRKMLPSCDENNSYIPKELNSLPPIYEKNEKTNEFDYKDVKNDTSLIARLQKECLKFAVQRNFYVYVKIVKLSCCINKTVINFTTNGMHHVGQDEIIILLEYDNSNLIPKDIFIHLNEIYRDAEKGQTITELGYSIAKQQNFLESKTESKVSTFSNGGFLYIRSTFQCLQEIELPESPFLIGILIHRCEIPWAKVFPLRLMLRLGAQYRYYPSPHLSIRDRKSVYGEIAQTIINFLADFRNYSYTIPTIKGMVIHMEERKTCVLIPKNRLDQIIKALDNSSDHILALGANFSKSADGHLVCIQNLEINCPDTHTYSTQAINIQGQPRRVTGASFIVLNGALKTNSGLSGKCSIVEDGLMVHVLPQEMQTIRKNLQKMIDTDIKCGPVEADESQKEIVSIQFTDNDNEINIGVRSPIDARKFDGISSIRIHSSLNYSNSNFVIRWTEVFLIQFKQEIVHGKPAFDVSKTSEQIARSASTALVPFLDLLVANGYIKIGLRVTIHQDNVCYEAGSNSIKLAPLYMNALDNELIPILHKHATTHHITKAIILELIFHILYK